MINFLISITTQRVKNKNQNFFYYDIRHSDEDFSLPVTLEKFVFVNYFGTLISTKPLDCLFTETRNFYQFPVRAYNKIHHYEEQGFFNGRILFPKL